MKTGWRVEDPLSSQVSKTVIRPRQASSSIDASYYQRLHEEDAGYMANNWLVAEQAVILSSKPKTVVEVGCGNGEFSRAIAGSVRKVYAVDWALSPKFVERPQNVLFWKADITKDKIPSGDITCSADVLEHFSAEDLTRVVGKCATSSSLQYHVIACYDDGHSHLTVMPPGAWLALWWRFCPRARLIRIDCRRNRPDQLVCVIGNITPPSP
ncbi:SAM-dependent methyltransferase [Sinorhizobium fredii]|uniref:class I SAM-dependent methyltransferase n=1 Tax=Rhizobium fredii TaxID=380 RepID=UPI00351921A5